MDSIMNIMLMITTLIVFGSFHPSVVECWLFSPRIAPYYYPFPYPVPASILTGGSSSASSAVAPTSTGTGYIGQTSIGASPDYNYNWYNYQSNPNSNVLFPSLSGGTTNPLGGIGSGITGSLFPLTGNTGFGGVGGAIPGSPGGISSMMPVPGSLLRSWWTRKFTKLGLRSPGSIGGGQPGMGSGVLGLGGGLGLGTSSLLGSSNPCNGYWASGGVSGGGVGAGPCSSNNLCCYPLVVQTTVDSTARPYHTDSVTYPTTGYLYQPQPHHGYKTSPSTSGQQYQTLRPQASEQVDEIVAESSRRDVD